MGVLCKEAIEFFTGLFHELDTDKSGNIDKSELGAAITKLAEMDGFPPPTKDEIDQAMKMMDTAGDGTVNLKEFLEFAAIVKDIVT
mmetsp:Transcript_5535/g.7980  ORF Transcript_5535/g.7980 Transcript_5535/m.7980 type:complete len:86 (+) Transcript_5535:42-299(+)|eukprot:CAMPEP_0195541602 /NCGR_PEP_ID=MMETSP0794_2-20130614/51164_1 /TAXON_ID=515487 /ORGANISM="Stephanopyxis turris, Strain CCMP 815" /LENGTH=85 /DNA_ID=CAMNT_0040675705 /DNA_START=41 /DNA_END=298 /DNA_ORIENTATION=+